MKLKEQWLMVCTLPGGRLPVEFLRGLLWDLSFFITLSMTQRIRQNVSSANLSVTPTWGVQLIAQRQACHSEGPSIRLEEWVYGNLMKFSRDKC